MGAAQRPLRRRRQAPRAAHGEPSRRDHASSKEALSDRAYIALEEMIVRLELRPGSAVSEVELSARLGIGRTPVREALQRLARERLVTILPRRSIIVSEIDVKSQLRLLELRREVERLASRGAARRSSEAERARFAELAYAFEASGRENDDIAFMRVDREFNELCVVAARNEFVAGAMRLTHALSRRFWFLHYKQAADMPLTAKLHADLARAIAAGDQEAAGRALDRLVDVLEAFTHATVTTDF